MTGLQLAPVDVIDNRLDYRTFVFVILSTIGSLIFGGLTLHYAKKAYRLEQELGTKQQEVEEELLKKQSLQQKVDLLFREDILRSSCVIMREESKDGLITDTQIFHCLIYKNNKEGEHNGWVVYVYDIANINIDHYFSTSYFTDDFSDLTSFPTKQSLINAILIKGFNIIDPLITKTGYRGVLSLVRGD